MDNFFLSAIVDELKPEVEGRPITKIISNGAQLNLDLRLHGEKFLVVSFDRASPGIYLGAGAEDRTRQVSSASQPFLLSLRKHIAGARIIQIEKAPYDRIIKVRLEGFDPAGQMAQHSLIIALTGSSTNAFLMDSSRAIISVMTASAAPLKNVETWPLAEPEVIRPEFDIEEALSQSEILNIFFGAGTLFAPVYKTEFIARCSRRSPASAFRSLVDDLFSKSPLPIVYSRVPLEEAASTLINLKSDLILSRIELTQAEGLQRNQFSTLSEAAETYYKAIERASVLRSQFDRLKQVISRQVKKSEAAIAAIKSDLARFDDPEKSKRFGDLLLANLATAKINGSKVRVTDYYEESQPEIEIDIGESKSLQQAAANYFSQYQKARRAQAAVSERIKELDTQLNSLKPLLKRLENSSNADEIASIEIETSRLLGIKQAKKIKPVEKRRARRAEQAVTGRWFRSTDGYEIGVGRNDRENDYLTFRVARSMDIWLHAADYPGSHVVVRNTTGAEVSQRAIVEAAELAAFYSQAKGEGKAAVHYTQRKYVTKPPRAKPGLVRLSSFKTLMVEPRCNLERIK